MPGGEDYNHVMLRNSNTNLREPWNREAWESDTKTWHSQKLFMK